VTEPVLPVPFENTDEDEEPVAKNDITKAVVTGTDWTTETILSQLRRGNIQLNPRFQRRDAWDVVRKSRFIESLLLGLPIPQLVLAEQKDRRGAFLVLDGKQRLLALRQFAVGSLASDDSDAAFSQLRLRGLDVREELEGTSLATLEQDGSLADDLNAFLNQTIRTVVVRSWPDEAFLNLVFLRLNTGSVSLSPQELRQALHPGQFTDFLDEYSADSLSVRRALRSDEPDFRMRDIEILLRFFAFHDYLSAYHGNLKEFLDTVTGELNASWAASEQAVRRTAALCDSAIDTTFAVFEENAFYRWELSKYERRFNRAVFDVMTYYFAQQDVAAISSERKEAVTAAFRNLCDHDAEFRQSIQATTKSITATHTRLYKWGMALSDALLRPVSVPELIDGRIHPIVS
jgi:hypothetical protein